MTKDLRQQLKEQLKKVKIEVGANDNERKFAVFERFPDFVPYIVWRRRTQLDIRASFKVDARYGDGAQLERPRIKAQQLGTHRAALVL